MGDGKFTELAQLVASGDSAAKEQLYALVYPELRTIAESMMRRQRRGHTLQPTALVNEVAVRVLGKESSGATLSSRSAFLALAATAMQNVLVDHARRRAAIKRTSSDEAKEVPLDEVMIQFQQTEQIDLLALDEAMQQLKAFSPRQHDVVVLRYFGGLRFDEIAANLRVSKSTIEKDWQFARAWLRRELQKGGD